jgi:hypothetical protein
MKLSFEPNRRLSAEDFRCLQDRPIFVRMLLNRLSVFIGDRFYDSNMVGINTQRTIDAWLMENAIGLFFVKLEDRDPTERRVDIYLTDPNDGFQLKLNMQGTEVRDW